MPDCSTHNVLRWSTPTSWVSQATRDLKSLLNDHAHLERKAANNALELLSRHPAKSDAASARHWTSVLAGIALDEVEHLKAVNTLLARRGGILSPSHRNPYATALRNLVRHGRAGELMDRLLISALIELRSFERFEMLADGITDETLGRLYRRLAVSEQGHYVIFLELASHVTSQVEVMSRWNTMLDAEAAIIAAQTPGPRMHSGTI